MPTRVSGGRIVRITGSVEFNRNRGLLRDTKVSLVVRLGCSSGLTTTSADYERTGRIGFLKTFVFGDESFRPSGGTSGALGGSSDHQTPGRGVKVKDPGYRRLTVIGRRRGTGDDSPPTRTHDSFGTLAPVKVSRGASSCTEDRLD